MQKIKKKYRTVKAVGPERTDVQTNERTYESEFIGSFRSLKTSGEPTRIFLDTTLPFNDSKQLSQVSDQVLDKSDVRIRRKYPKT